MRDFFKQSYSITYFQQLEVSKRNPSPPRGCSPSTAARRCAASGVETFAQAVASTRASRWPGPRSCASWPTLPTATRRTPSSSGWAAFRDSNHDFKTLVRELFSSPLVTYADKTTTSEATAAVIGIARRETLCTRLSNRWGSPTSATSTGHGLAARRRPSARNLSLGIAGSSYARADETPVMPHDPNLFFSSATEKLCMCWPASWSRTRPAAGRVHQDAALNDFVHGGDGRAGQRRAVPAAAGGAGRHYDGALAAREKPADALRSTFVLACSSPDSVSSGL
jgi:hypothetical protein